MRLADTPTLHPELSTHETARESADRNKPPALTAPQVSLPSPPDPRARRYVTPDTGREHLQRWHQTGESCRTGQPPALCRCRPDSSPEPGRLCLCHRAVRPAAWNHRRSTASAVPPAPPESCE